MKTSYLKKKKKREKKDGTDGLKNLNRGKDWVIGSRWKRENVSYMS